MTPSEEKALSLIRLVASPSKSALKTTFYGYQDVEEGDYKDLILSLARQNHLVLRNKQIFVN